MVRPILLITSLLSLGIETYHVACVAYDAVDKAAYITEPFEQECSTGGWRS